MITVMERRSIVLSTAVLLLSTIVHYDVSGKSPKPPPAAEYVGHVTFFAWGPFFQAYVNGTEIPSFAWRWSLDGESENRVLNVSVEASNVPPGFALPIPLAVEFRGGRVRYTFIQMDGATKIFHIPMSEPPVRVSLNPKNAVLARIEASK